MFKRTAGLLIAIICAIICLSGHQSAKADTESLFRSSSLREIREIDGNVEKRTFVNEDGKITCAADRGYAIVRWIKGDHTILEEYYDADEKPTAMPGGYYAILREYDENGQEYKTTFLGTDKQPVVISAGYSSIIHTYDEDGKVITDRYYDLDSNPVKSRYDGYGCNRKYDLKGRNNLIIHVDEKDEPMIAGNGYAAVRRIFYEDGPFSGRVKDEFYLDTQENPIRLSLGQYGLHKEYDELGRTSTLVYLDSEGNPSPTTKGYTSVKRTFYEDDSIRTEQYYDADGKPFRLPDGQYGILKQDGKNIYLNSAGKPLFNVKNQLNNNQWIVVMIVLVLVAVSVVCIRKVNTGLLVFYVLGVLYVTLSQRNDVSTGLNLVPFWSYFQFFSKKELRWEIINNILLFIPLGAFLYHLYPRKSILLVPIALSVMIECVQYAFGLGLCELDDVISNGLGGLIGFAAGKLTTDVKLRIKKWSSL